ncbi:MAG TPA: 50S ribosomal protein L11 methyltransferase, partial [Desulfomonilaceae bacterium]|nr:50S ribosomal protein L11 methyltransferase [Desulfomonilaceae bacterium]
MIDSREEWIALHVTVARELGDAVANFCHERGSTGVVLDDFGEMTRITAYFEKAGGQSVFRDVQHYLNVLRELFPDSPEPVLDTELLETENWAVMWQDNFKPMKIGKR